MVQIGGGSGGAPEGRHHEEQVLVLRRLMRLWRTWRLSPAAASLLLPPAPVPSQPSLPCPACSSCWSSLFPPLGAGLTLVNLAQGVRLCCVRLVSHWPHLVLVAYMV